MLILLSVLGFYPQRTRAYFYPQHSIWLMCHMGLVFGISPSSSLTVL